jgi:hypothetical protein
MTTIWRPQGRGQEVFERFEDGFGGSEVSFIVFMKRRIGKATHERAAETDTGKIELYQCSRETTSHQQCSMPQREMKGRNVREGEKDGATCTV